MKTNSERIVEIKRFVSPFPDEAQAKFGADVVIVAVVVDVVVVVGQWEQSSANCSAIARNMFRI